MSFFLFIVFIVYTMLPFSMKGAVIASGITCLSHTVTLSVCLTSTATKLEPLIWQVRLIFFLVVETLVWKKYSSLRAVNIYQSLLQTEMGNQLLVQLKWRMYWFFSNEVWFVKKWSILKPPWFTMTFRNFQWKEKKQLYSKQWCITFLKLLPQSFKEYVDNANHQRAFYWK